MHLKKIIGVGMATAGLSVAVLTQTMPVASAATPATSHSAATPKIKWRDCSGSSRPTENAEVWLNNGQIFEDWCFSYKGTWKFNTAGGNNLVDFCSGNNSGSLVYLYKNKSYTLKFGPGRHYKPANVEVLATLTITGYSGKDTCS
jgi:hypothetical protein